ncbi:SOS response-associated peptidase family protein [Winogradskyella maritima]|nr:SOS response-associated peptidase family protein [Winogradskyella maritima]
MSKDGFVTFTVLTKKQLQCFSEIHNTKNRRPVILADEEVAYWLDNNLEQEDILDVIQNDLQDYHFNALPY